MAPTKLILYDLPSRDPNHVTWSFNTWRIRMTLNYKKIDYETVWLEYPDIAPKLKALGVAPGDDPETPYTVPTVRFPDGAFLMNSRYIIGEIEKRYTSPEYPILRHDEANRKIAVDLLSPFFETLQGVMFPRVPKILLNEASVGYFQTTRKEYFGMSLDELEAEKGGLQAWTDSEMIWDHIAATLKGHGGPFLLGDEVTFADFVLAGYLQFIHRVAHDEYKKLVLPSRPEIRRFHEACRPWLERDSH